MGDKKSFLVLIFSVVSIMLSAGGCQLLKSNGDLRQDKLSGRSNNTEVMFQMDFDAVKRSADKYAIAWKKNLLEILITGDKTWEQVFDDRNKRLLRRYIILGFSTAEKDNGLSNESLSMEDFEKFYISALADNKKEKDELEKTFIQGLGLGPNGILVDNFGSGFPDNLNIAIGKIGEIEKIKYNGKKNKEMIENIMLSYSKTIEIYSRMLGGLKRNGFICSTEAYEYFDRNIKILADEINSSLRDEQVYFDIEVSKYSDKSMETDGNFNEIISGNLAIVNPDEFEAGAFDYFPNTENIKIINIRNEKIQMSYLPDEVMLQNDIIKMYGIFEGIVYLCVNETLEFYNPFTLEEEKNVNFRKPWNMKIAFVKDGGKNIIAVKKGESYDYLVLEKEERRGVVNFILKEVKEE